MSRIVSFVSYDGGIGKTSIIFGLSILLSKKGYRVLVFDSYFSFNKLSLFYENKFNLDSGKKDLKDFLVGNLPGEECLINIEKNLYLLKTNDISFDYKSRSELIKFFISEIQYKFDYILVDCNSFDDKILKNCLTFSTEIFSVVNDTEYSIRNASKLLKKINFFKSIKNKKLIINNAHIIGQIKNKNFNIKDIEDLLKTECVFMFPKFYKNNFFHNEKNEYIRSKIFNEFVFAFENNLSIIIDYQKKYKGFLGFLKRRLIEKYER